jgi:predicted RNA binding protein YcfA (HicA-like mRNA interferase family)
VSRYPALNGKEVIHVLQSFGFEDVRMAGSHHMLWKPGHPTIVPVPVHGSHPLPEGTLRSIIRLAGLNRERFFGAL